MPLRIVVPMIVTGMMTVLVTIKITDGRSPWPGQVFRNRDLASTLRRIARKGTVPQGHVQLLVNLIDFRMNLQEAIDLLRIRHLKSMEAFLEEGISDKTAAELTRRGHQIIVDISSINQVGGGRAIYFDRERNILLGASDRRKDGCAIGY
jgi:gamma-glutamyltranspeptidase